MAASAKKKNKKGKTISLTDFLAEEGGTGGGSTYVFKSVSWADETDDLEGGVSTNLPYDVTEESIKEFFRGLSIRAVRIPREPSNPERLKGFGHVEFEDLNSLLSALSLSEESLGNRRIGVDVADQAQDKDRDGHSFGRDRNRDSDKTDTDWRARSATDSFDDHPPRRGDDNRYDSDQYGDGYWYEYPDGPCQDMDRYGGRNRYDDRGSRDYARGCDSWIGSGRRACGSGYRRDDDYRGSRDHYEDRYNRRDDGSCSSRDNYSPDDYRCDDRRPKLNLKPHNTPKGDDSSASTSHCSRAASVFGGVKPVDTAAREREVEERLQKEQEKLQRQLDEPKLERRHASWRSEETQKPERSRTGSESSQTGTSATPNRRRRESEMSLENETLNKKKDCHSPTSKSPKPDQPLKVMPAPPPKENAWVNSDTEHQYPTNGGGKVTPAQLSEERPARKDENKVGGMNVPKDHTGNSSCGPGDPRNKDHWKESDRKDGKKDQDSRSAPEPKKPEENPASEFSSTSRYSALSVDGEDENKGEDYTE
uniref:RRM domain-containing protein n=1 Tax=Colobus angolensis palliatus TaxID=336983 RepID=A0A2K5KDR7_COLAP